MGRKKLRTLWVCRYRADPATFFHFLPAAIKIPGIIYQ